MLIIKAKTFHKQKAIAEKFISIKVCSSCFVVICECERRQAGVSGVKLVSARRLIVFIPQKNSM